MLHRPLALVTVLAAGDYALWNWSLQGSHDASALVSGLTLPPLLVALLWLLALNLARLLANTARRPPARGAARARRAGRTSQEGRRSTRARGRTLARRGNATGATAATAHAAEASDDTAAPAGRGTDSASSSSKLAA